MTRFKIVIPARYASTRLPGKPLADIHGRPMIVRVADRAAHAGAEGVWVATGSPEVSRAVAAHGYRAVMTDERHLSGTDRIAEVATRFGWADEDIVVNVQGDEPFVPIEAIRRLAAALHEDPAAAIATGAHRIRDRATLFDPNVVKVVLDQAGRALYFSRAPIPFARDDFRDPCASLPEGLPALHHIGLYAYRVGFLKTYSALAAPELERFEALEQLRALWAGYRIRVVVFEAAPPRGVDTPDDLAEARRRVAAGET